MKNCSVHDCVNLAKTRGYCSKHAEQLRLHGRIVITKYDDRPAIVRGQIALVPLGRLAQQGYAVVDIQDAWVSKYKWYLDTGGYVNGWVDGRDVALHRLLTDAPEGLEVDHHDLDKKNNRRSNLRVCTGQQNIVNRPTQVNNTSGYKGVWFDPRRGKWVAKLNHNGKCFNLGRFATAEEAAAAYDRKAVELHGAYARLNLAAYAREDRDGAPWMTQHEPQSDAHTPHDRTARAGISQGTRFHRWHPPPTPPTLCSTTTSPAAASSTS
jgi:hypothetical protein